MKGFLKRRADLAKEETMEPCKPDMTLESVRLRSFTGWPHNNTIPARDMAMAGFYYTGKEDKVRCFFCDLPLNKWQPTDDPIEEHLKHGPECPYVKEKAGAEKSEIKTSQCLYIKEKAGTGKSEIPMIREYKIIRRLKEGAFGIVYHVTKNKQEYAIKEMPSLSDKKDSATYELQFALERKSHQHLVTIYDFFSDFSKDCMYMVMEYCGGGNLNDHVINDNPPMKTISCYMEDMADGLEFLHENGFMHRDLKPENVLMAVPKKGRMLCKLADFGLTKTLQTDQDAFKTVCGTPMFVAPEIMKAHEYSFSADIFSLGLVFFAVATGMVSERSPSFLEPRLDKMGNKWINQIVGPSFNKKKFSKTYFPYVPELGNLIADMISFDPEDRPTAENVYWKVNKIRQILEDQGEEESETSFWQSRRGERAGRRSAGNEARRWQSREREEEESGIFTMATNQERTRSWLSRDDPERSGLDTWAREHGGRTRHVGPRKN